MSRADAAVDGGTRLPPQAIGERSARHRSLDERLSVRFPWAFRPVVAAVLRLPAGSRLRGAALARSMSRAYAAANRRDFELILTFNDPDRYEYRPSRAFLPPDMDTVYHGADGYRRFWRLWLDAFENIRWDPEEIVDFGEKVLVKARQSGRGSGSGVAVSESVFQVFTFSRGMVVRQEDFLDRDDALRAVRG
ncbi:MAG TPA: nuclear transport factor 2 family protein [Thermoleophilaceae bacterium]|nr:nuclear transport factor 2 family protein [Thermoleophilaceae bacterium]